MSIPMHLLLVVAAVCVCFSEGAPDGRVARAKQQRPTRGFKNLEMMTARGFGKRGRPSPRTEPDVRESSVDQMPLQRTYRTPKFKSKSPNFAYGPGKRASEREFEGDVEDHLPERTNHMPTFVNSQRVANGIGTYGKRTAQMRTEAGYRRYNPKSSMMVATDFGKRGHDESAEEDEVYRIRRIEFKPDNRVGVAIGYGKRVPIKRVYGLDNFWETLASPEREGQEMDDEKLESIPMDWFVNEIVNNPDFARSVLRKFVDINQDGMLSSDELLRNV